MATEDTAPPSTPLPSRPLPLPFNTSTQPLQLITQGAEALLYKTVHLSASQPAALKIRPPKPWRHPTLDKRLTRQRILAEARVLVKCLREGVCVPAVWAVDWEEGWSLVEWIEGGTVKEWIRQRGQEEEGLRALLGKMGRAVGKLHAAGVVHGDLTTSNMMLRPAKTPQQELKSPQSSEEQGNPEVVDAEIVLIDFGLATQAVQEEDRAVDLYVLERAFGSTHPKEEGLFGLVLEAYGSSYKGAKSTLRRLEDVRMRGRKKSMIG